MNLRTIGFALVLGATACASAQAQTTASQAADRPDILALKLGAPVGDQPAKYREFACGTNGGPPSSLIAGFAEFAKCAPEPATGLHEVTFRYDDELEYYALAMNLGPIAERYGGTNFGTFPVIVSALFDDAGVLRGYRIVTDDRGTPRQRRVAYTMSVYAKSVYKAAQWQCESLPLDDGETPVGRKFVKEDCTGTTTDGQTLKLRTRFLHRPGQVAIDPHTGKVNEGAYESTVRLEVFAAGWKMSQ